MSFKLKQANLGKLDLNIFDFDKVGDILPRHTHGKEDIHISVIARGSFIIRGDGWSNNYSAGDVIDWEVGQFHEYEAKEDNSRIVNILK